MDKLLGKASLCLIGIGALAVMFPTLERLIKNALNVVKLTYWLQLFNI